MLRREDVGGTERRGNGSLFEGTWTKRSRSMGSWQDGSGEGKRVGDWPLVVRGGHWRGCDWWRELVESPWLNRGVTKVCKWVNPDRSACSCSMVLLVSGLSTKWELFDVVVVRFLFSELVPLFSESRGNAVRTG